MPLQPLNLFAKFQAGRQAADEQYQSTQRNALVNMQMQDQKRVNALRADPNATPEQFIRAGDPQTAQALTAQSQVGQQQKQAAIQQIGGLAQQAIQSGQAKEFVSAALANPAYAQVFKAAGVDPSQINLNSPTFDNDLQSWASLGQSQKPIEVSAGTTLINPITGKNLYSAPQKRNVEWKDTGDKLIPVYSDSGEDVPGLVPKKKGLTPVQSATSPESLLSPQGLEIAAQQFYADGTLPKGMGRGAAAINAKIMSRGAQIAAENGDDAKAAVLNRNAFTATRKAQADTLKQFSAGKNGNTVRSLNVAVQHLDQLSQLGTALQNGDVPLLNKLGNAWAKQTGKAAPVTFDAMKKIVADEIVKAVVGSGGGVADREEASRSMNNAQSPAQMAEVIQNYKGLMAGQLNGLRQQYAEGTGREDFERFLLPVTRAELETHTQSQASSQVPADIAALLQKHGAK